MVGHAEGVLEAGLVLSLERVVDLAGAVLVAEVEQPAADERLDASLRRPAAPCGCALISLSATYRFLPSVARPLGWAKLADASGPSRDVLAAVAGVGADLLSLFRSSAQI